jgi:cytochrome b561
MKKVLPSRYHPLLITLHWLIAVLILAMIGVGFFVLARMSNIDPPKITVLLIHMSVGMLVFALMSIRLLLRVCTARPAGAMTGYAGFDRIAPLVHYGFYILVFAMAGTGLATAIAAGLNRSIFQGSGEPLPASFIAYPTFTAHFYLAWLLVGFLLLHVLAALYHQFSLKDGLFRRMWFGRGS